MSQISSTHNIVLASSVKGAFEGQRLVPVHYKAGKDKDGKTVAKRFENHCASIPQVGTITEAQMMALRPYIISQLLEVAQNAIVKDQFEAGARSVSDAELSVDSCIAKLGEVSTWTDEQMVEWYTDTIAPSLVAALAAKFGIGANPTPPQVAKLEQFNAQYQALIVSMNGGKPNFAPAVCDQLLKVFAFGGDDGKAKALTARVQKMSDAHKLQAAMVEEGAL